MWAIEMTIDLRTNHSVPAGIFIRRELVDQLSCHERSWKLRSPIRALDPTCVCGRSSLHAFASDGERSFLARPPLHDGQLVML